MKGADVLCHLPKKEDKGNSSDDLGAEDSNDDEGEDGEHVEHGVGGNGHDSSGDVVVINNSSTFMCKP